MVTSSAMKYLSNLSVQHVDNSVGYAWIDVGQSQCVSITIERG